MRKVGLFDADIFIFQATAAAQFDATWDNAPNIVQRYMNMSEAQGHIKQKVDEIKQRLGLDEVIMCLSDSLNWRLQINPDYKANRKYTDRPVGLHLVHKWVTENFNCIKRPTLEADDVMGILASWDGFKPDYRKIIISEDKDMKTIPCWLYNPASDFQEYEITEEEADVNFYSQAIGGDRVDGYAGCSGVGVQTARKYLQKHRKVEEYEHVFKSGKRKGESETRWKDVDSESHWETTLSLYAKAGQTPDDALINARMARICRASDYDFKNKKVKLWVPNN